MAARKQNDGKTGTPLDKYKRVPEGERVIVALPIKDKQTAKAGGTTEAKVYVRLKEGTAKQLGLTAVTELVKGKNGKSIVRGVKGTKSFKLLFSKAVQIGGAEVKTVSIPVPGSVGVTEFYAWAKTLTSKGVNGITTPSGVSYRFTIDVSDDKAG